MGGWFSPGTWMIISLFSSSFSEKDPVSPADGNLKSDDLPISGIFNGHEKTIEEIDQAFEGSPPNTEERPKTCWRWRQRSQISSIDVWRGAFAEWLKSI